MEPVFEYVFDEAQMRRGWKLAQKRWRGLDLVVLVFGLINLVLAFLSVLVLRNPGGWVLLVPAFYLLTMPWIRRRQFLRRLEETPGFGGRVRWELGAEQIRVTALGGEGEGTGIPWSVIHDAQQDDSGVVLRTDQRSFLWLPWDGLVAGTREEVEQRLKLSVGGSALASAAAG